LNDTFDVIPAIAAGDVACHLVELAARDGQLVGLEISEGRAARMSHRGQLSFGAKHFPPKARREQAVQQPALRREHGAHVLIALELALLSNVLDDESADEAWDSNEWHEMLSEEFR
jgi:hypothetical protein